MNIVPGITPLSKEWHRYREKRVSGTSVANILGEGRFGSPLKEWARLTGKMMRPEVDSDYADWGTESEPLNAQWFTLEHEVIVSPSPGLVAHPTIDWLCCTPDGTVGNRLWEAKSSSTWGSSHWSDGVPMDYLVQFQVMLEVCGLDGGWISYLSPGSDVISAMLAALRHGGVTIDALKGAGFRLEVYELERDQAFIDNCMEKLQRFWRENVEADVPPPAGPNDADALAAVADERRARFTAAEQAMWDEWQLLSEDEKAAKKRKAEIQNRLAVALGKASWTEAKKETKRLAQ